MYNKNLFKHSVFVAGPVNHMSQNGERRTADAPGVRAGMYLLYAIDKEGFENIKPELSGDDHFFHDEERYPHPTRWIDLDKLSLAGDKEVHVWLHYDHYGESGASRLLHKMSPDKTGEMKFLNAWNTGISLEMHINGMYTSRYAKRR